MVLVIKKNSSAGYNNFFKNMDTPLNVSLVKVFIRLTNEVK
jgi:hypothetical protein